VGEFGASVRCFILYTNVC